MSKELSKALDDSLASLETGQASIEECLSRYPEHAAELRPLLKLALQVSQSPRPVADSAAFFAGRQKMLKALAEKTRRPAGIRGLFYRWEKRPALRWAPAVLAVLILLAVGTLFIQSWPEARAPQVTTLEQADGPVEILFAGSDTWQTASTGDPVKAGDRIATGPLASVTLAFFDGSTTALEAETKIAIVQMDTKRDGSSKAIILHQEVGRTYSSVQPLLSPDAHFEIKTPAAVMAVRGTEFALDVDSDGTTHMEVVEGTVDVIAEGVTISVPAGQAAEVRPGAHPALIVTKEPTLSSPTQTPWAAESEPTETAKPTQMPQHEPTQTPKHELTQTPEPTQTPKSRPTPTPTPTPEPPKPTKKPHPTHPPHPTERPKPTKKSK